jgi:hypothetical protein
MWTTTADRLASWPPPHLGAATALLSLWLYCGVTYFQAACLKAIPVSIPISLETMGSPESGLVPIKLPIFTINTNIIAKPEPDL